ncbi:hypothetical protein BGZ68_010076 [Mortierella alpina]|nr:hypothetical protein BGZ68_010076 [Mortierella alpina]
MSLQYLSAPYHRLDALELKNTARMGIALQNESDLQQLLLRIVCTNSALNTLSLNRYGQYTTREFWKACLERLGELQSVNVLDVHIDDDAFSWFWATLARAERISVTSSSWEVDTNSKSPINEVVSRWPDPALRLAAQQVEICDLSFESVLQQWQVLVQCSEARAIRWRCFNIGVPALSLRHILSPEIWPQLQRLDLGTSGISDESISLLLDTVNPLLHLSAYDTCFGKLATQSLLLRHITALQYLYLSGCTEMTSPDIQRILTSGNQLETFKAFRLHVEVLEYPDSKPWVCTELKSLKLYFDIQLRDAHTAHRLVFEQLARLPHMQVFDISRAHNDLTWTSLRLRLDFGLNLIAGWKNLVELQVTQVLQDLETEDAEWMAKHWCLTRMEGSLNSNEKKHKTL